MNFCWLEYCLHLRRLGYKSPRTGQAGPSALGHILLRDRDKETLQLWEDWALSHLGVHINNYLKKKTVLSGLLKTSGI